MTIIYMHVVWVIEYIFFFIPFLSFLKLLGILYVAMPESQGDLILFITVYSYLTKSQEYCHSIIQALAIFAIKSSCFLLATSLYLSKYLSQEDLENVRITLKRLYAQIKVYIYIYIQYL